jgi:hypothetical protein
MLLSSSVPAAASKRLAHGWAGLCPCDSGHHASIILFLRLSVKYFRQRFCTTGEAVKIRIEAGAFG